MKFFSKFLGGGADSASTTVEPSPAPVEAPAPATVVPEPPAAQPPATSELPGGFTPPPGWDINAFTAPPPDATPKGTPIVVDPHVTAELRDRVVDVLKTVFDPEIPVDIYELGLIYDIQADATRHVHVTMTLTSPACPSAQQLPSEVQYKVKAVDGVTDASVEVVWEPPWDKDRMSEMAKLTLGMF